MGIAVDATTRLSTVVNNRPSTDVYDPQPLDSVYRVYHVYHVYMYCFHVYHRLPGRR